MIVGDMMRGALIEIEARTILNQGKSLGEIETKKRTALIMLQDGELSIEKLQSIQVLKLQKWNSLQGFRQCKAE